MGEMADFIEWCSPDNDEDIYNGLELDDASGPPRSFKTCRCCGKKNLEWGRSGGKWRLFELNGELHDCPAKPLTGDPIMLTREYKDDGKGGFAITMATDHYENAFWRDNFLLLLSRLQDPSTEVARNAASQSATAAIHEYRAAMAALSEEPIKVEQCAETETLERR